MQSYLDVLAHVRETGLREGDRTGTPSVSGPQLRLDLVDAVPTERLPPPSRRPDAQARSGGAGVQGAG